MFFILQSTDFKVQNVEGEKEREREKIFEYSCHNRDVFMLSIY
jgi:hypothetical protein